MVGLSQGFGVKRREISPCEVVGLCLGIDSPLSWPGLETLLRSGLVFLGSSVEEVSDDKGGGGGLHGSVAPMEDDALASGLGFPGA